MRRRRLAHSWAVLPERGLPRRITAAITALVTVAAGLTAVAAPATADSSATYASLVDGRASLLAHWRLGEASGTTAADTTGRHDGTYTGSPTLGTAGAIADDTDTAVGFNGATSKITLPPLGTAVDFTIEGWTNLLYCGAMDNTMYGNVGTVRLLIKCQPTSLATAYASVWLSGTEYSLAPYDMSLPSNANTWVHWGLTRQANTLTLYRDGQQIAQRSDLPATAPATLDGAIGAQSNGNYPLFGRIDEVAVYASALSATDVSADYQAGQPTSAQTVGYKQLVLGEPSLRDYWRLGEANGAVAVDSAGSNNGTYVFGNGLQLGQPGALTGDTDTAARFYGTTGKVSVPALGTFGDFTIEGWTHLEKNTVVNNTLFGNVGTVRLLVRPGSGWYTPTVAYASVWLNGMEYSLQPNAAAANPQYTGNYDYWVHWALVRQKNTLTLYRDGLQIGQRADLPADAPATLTGAIGTQANGNYALNGRVDEVAIYATALGAAALTNHYIAGVDGFLSAAP
jgi:hypothetical protein